LTAKIFGSRVTTQPEPGTDAQRNTLHNIRFVGSRSRLTESLHERLRLRDDDCINRPTGSPLDHFEMKSSSPDGVAPSNASTLARRSIPRVRNMRHTRVVVSHYGGPEVITVIEEDIPIPNADEVRVKVLAAGVSLPDVLAREGVHPETPRVPYTPGWDLVGTVEGARRAHEMLGEGGVLGKIVLMPNG
jgi:Alcohol dehydrogenase GroES-like domain